MHGVSKSTVSLVLNNFIDAINGNLDNIRFPLTREEQQKNRLEFYRKCRIPGVLGAIDGTLIPIIAPTHQEEAYRCRKGFHALNVQAVTDCNLKFIDLVAKWPGSQHDSAIFNSCGLKSYLEENPVGLLLGDSGYALKRYMLTPKLQATTPQEERFNAAHKTGRVVVERAFGVLKSRFRCLHRSGGCLPFRPEKCTRVVTACVRLHNLCCDRGIPMPDGNYTNEVVDDQIVQPDGGNAVADRNRIINLF